MGEVVNVAIFHTDNLGSGYGSKKELEVKDYHLVGRIEVDLDSIKHSEDSKLSSKGICEHVFGRLNMGSGVEDWAWFKKHKAWDDANLDQLHSGHRPHSSSLSVGDVLAVGESFYRCESMGFEEIPFSDFTKSLYSMAAERSL